MALLEAIASAISNVGQGTQAAARLTPAQSLAVGQTESPKFELTRAGRRFQLGVSAAITGIAPVTATPTTAAQFALYNASATKSMFIESLGCYVSSGTPGVGGTLMACIFTLPATTDTIYSGFKIADCSGSGNASAVIPQASVTITTPAAPAWFHVAANNNSNVGAFPGSGNMYRGEQGLLLPPGSALGLAVVGLAGSTPLYVPTCEWVELITTPG